MARKSYPLLPAKAILSPMAGVNDLAFRQLCEQQGAGLVFTEMMPAQSILRKKEFLSRYFKTVPEEQRLGVQLMAAHEQEAVYAAKQFERVAHVIDLNVGCPSKTIRKVGAGSALLSDTSRLLSIVRALTEEIRVPVSVKIRLGETDSKDALSLAKDLEDAGAAAIGVHARTVAQGYSGKADWSMIKRIKQEVSVPVIGNGDVTSPEKAKAMLEETGCDYVMVGRGALGRPYLFAQINALLQEGSYAQVTPTQHIAFFSEYLALAKRFGIGWIGIKTHAMYFTTGLPHAPALRRTISACKNVAQVERAYADYATRLPAGESLNTDELPT